MTTYEINGFLGALLLHFGLAIGLMLAPKRLPKAINIVEVDVRKQAPPPAALPPPPPIAKEIPPPEPPPKKVKVKREPTPPQAPIPNKEVKDPPKEPVKPIFGLTADSVTAGDSTFTAPVGNTTIADPRTANPKAKPQPLPPAPPHAAPAPVFTPASPLEIAEDADPDEDAIRIPARLYPEEARSQGLEGDTKLRVEIDANGKVVSVKVLPGGPGKILDDLAATWMRTHGRFKPARNKKKEPVATRITYTYQWRIDR